MFSHQINSVSILNFQVYFKFLVAFKLAFLFLMLDSTMADEKKGSKTVSIKANNILLSVVFNELRIKTSYHFLYLKDDLENAHRVSLDFKDSVLDDILKHCFNNQPLTYKIQGHRVLVKKKGLPILTVSKQQIIVSGKITDEKGEALPGVTVMLKNTSVGTSSDDDGNYKIVLEDEGGVLVFSLMGYLTKEVQAGVNVKINVSLREELTNLKEVIVTGYSAQAKKDIIGSISVVNVNDLKSVPAGSPEQMLQGRAAGLNIVTSGSPGSESNIRIRGITSLGNNNPLVLIDGVQGSLLDINSNDIESIQVLKDAGAAAIYGVRGSNGVIVVTTKKGTSTEPKLTYDAYYGIQKPPSGNVFNLLNSQEMASVTWKAMINSNQLGANGYPSHAQYGNGPNPIIPDYILVGNEAGVFGELTATQLGSYNIDFDKGSIYQITKANKEGTDWFHEIFSLAPLQNHSLSVSSASNKSSYFFSTAYYDQQGTLMNTYLKRYSVRANTNFNINNNIRIGENLYVYYRDSPISHTGIQNESDTTNPIMLSFMAQPIIPVFDIKGNYAGTRARSLGQSPNPYAVSQRDGSYKNNSWATQGNVFAEIDFLEHFKAKSTFGGTFSNGYSKNFLDRTYENAENNPISSYNEGASLNRQWTFTNTINYEQKLENHNVKVLIGLEAVENYGRTVGGRSLGYFSTDPDYLTLSTGSSGFTNYSTVFKQTLYSQFGKADYSYLGRYLISATLRRDGSSRFGKQRRWGVFPAFSGGWRLSGEPFLKDLSWIDNLMLRASWGKLGSELNVEPSNAFTQFGSGLQTSYYDINGTGNTPIQGFNAIRIGNEQTGWEEDVLSNFGIDLSLLRGKLDFSVEYYLKSVNGLLFTDQSPATVGGAALPTVNIGNIENKGIDFNAKFIQNIEDFQFDIGFNVTHYKSNIANLPNKYFDTGLTRTGNFVRNQVGHPVGSFFGYQVERLFRDAADVSNSATQDAAAPGRFKYSDINGDGVISDKDRTFIGNPNPNFTYGINIGGNYKNFDLSIFIYGSQGNDAVNYSRWWTDFYPSFQGAKSKNLLYNSWRPDNLNAKTPIIENVSNFSNNAVPNSYYIEDASFVKLKSLVIGYTIPNLILKKIGIDRLRIYVQGINLFTSTKYTGVDPELAGTASAFGIDFGNYPNNQQNFNIGMSLKF